MWEFHLGLRFLFLSLGMRLPPPGSHSFWEKPPLHALAHSGALPLLAPLLMMCAWGLLSFLDLWLYRCHQFWGRFVVIA